MWPPKDEVTKANKMAREYGKPKEGGMTDAQKAWDELVRWSEQFANVALTHKMQVAILAKDAECKGLAKQYVDMKSFADFTEKENKRLRDIVQRAGDEKEMCRILDEILGANKFHHNVARVFSAFLKGVK